MRKITKRLLLVVIVLCILLLGVGVFLVSNIVGITREYDDILDNYISDEEIMLNTSNKMYRIQSLAASYIILDESDKVGEYGKKIDDLKLEILRDFDQFKDTLEVSGNLYHSIYSEFISFMSHESMARELTRNGSSKTAKYYVNNVMEQKLESINKSLDIVYDTIDTYITEAKKDVRAYKNIIWIISAVTLGVVIFVVAFCLIYFKRSSVQIVETYDNELQRHNLQIISIQRHTIEGMAELVESRDSSTGGHVKRTAIYVGMLARQLKKMGYCSDILSDQYIESLERFAPLHDIGKIIVPDAILLKPGKYETEEFEAMKKHTIVGEQIVKNILKGTEADKDVALATEIAGSHHEKWDGTGYPRQLSGEDIPLAARIMAVADVYDALVSERCYKEAFEYDKACRIIEESSGTHFDPKIVEAFIKLKGEFLSILKNNLRESEEA